MKMETPVKAPQDGTVATVDVARVSLLTQVRFS